MKKRISLVLCLIMLLSLLASCGEDIPESKTGVTNELTATEPAVETTSAETDSGERKFIKDGLSEEIDYEGEPIYIYVRQSFAPEIMVEEKNEDLINDAIYERQLRVQERLGLEMKITGVGTNKPTAYQAIETALKANAGNMDVICMNYFNGGLNLGIKGYLLNLQESEYLDFSKPWWSDKFISSSTPDADITYFAAGHISANFVTYSNGIAVNTSAYERKIGNRQELYDLIIDRKWTMDEYKKMLKGTYEDLQGNGMQDEDDFYGLYTTKYALALNAFTIGAGVKYTTRDGSGKPVLSLNNTSSSAACEAVSELFYDSEGVYFIEDTSHTKFVTRFDKFREGKAMTIYAYISDMVNFRDLEDDYTLIPFPMLDEDQGEYMTYMSPDITAWAIPTITSDADKAAIFMEAMASDAYNLVTPQIYEQAFQAAYARDPMTARMLDIVVDTAYIDFGLVHSEMIGNLYNFLTEDVYSTSTGTFASAYDKNSKIWESGLESLIDSYLSTWYSAAPAK